MSKIVSNEVIQKFLEGNDPQKYIISVEPDYSSPSVDLIINHPETGKKIETHKYEPFLWFKEDITKIMYGGKRMEIIKAREKFEVTFKKLRTSNDEGYVPERMENGYKYIAKTKKSYNNLITFFKEGGIDVFSPEFSKSFILFSPVEQFLIQTGKRLFKGIDDYNDLHRFQYDLETEGLLPSKNAIFQIGVKDNRGIEHVLETIGDTPSEKRDSERENIKKFFKIIDFIKPDIIAGYNSENFDWAFLFERAERLGIPINEVAITLNRAHKIKRKSSTIKLGGETESYLQTNMYGYNIIDVSHAVRRAMAINSEIKSWSLKYITQYSEIAKPNRVYVPGGKINSIWSDKENDYAFNESNGSWYKITDRKKLKSGFKVVTGAFIVQRYLCDDLWETEQIDNLFNQASFLIGKLIPTTFMRSSTMGTAGQWKLIMCAWSYENDLAIPETQTKREFTGGLSRLLNVGYATGVAKLDFAALYPKSQLTWDVFPDLDISGVMRGLLTYIVDTRDYFKELTGVEKGKFKKLQKFLKDNNSLSKEEKTEILTKINEHKRLSNFYDKKQLPLKILANSWFGSYGAPYIFNWGDIDSAEETTCRGRQSLRLMVKFFTEKYKFKPLVLDTDGCNFSFPEDIDNIKYIAKGNHWKTKDDANKELSGLDAVLAEFNETYMEGRMGLDLDEICNSTINFGRKNYANDIDGKIKLVGNSVKSKKMPVYIEEFLGKSIRLLLNGDGHSFINEYYSYVDKIYNFQIPLIKIASKANVKTTISDYKKKSLLKNKAGNPMPKQAHMELAIKNNLDVNLGDTLYYVNTGSSKSNGDIKTIVKSKLTKKGLEKYVSENGHEPTSEITVQLNCRLITPEIVERDFEMIEEIKILENILNDENSDIDDIERNEILNRLEVIRTTLYTEDYNVGKYLEMFNKKVKPLLVCFKPEIRDRILLNIIRVKDKKTKTTSEMLKEREIFTKNECQLISGIPFNEKDQDSYESLMTMDDKEIKFWDRVNKTPNFMENDEWEIIRKDYKERMEKLKEEGILNEKNTLKCLFKELEIDELEAIKKSGIIPIKILSLVDISDDLSGNLISRKWGVTLYNLSDVFLYEEDAINRNEFYIMKGIQNYKNKYELWIDYLNEQKTLTGETLSINESNDDLDTKIISKIIDNSKSNTPQKPIITEDEPNSDSDDEDNDEETSNIIDEEKIQLDDEYDDTQSEKPEGYNIVKPIIDDEWPF